MLSDLIAQPQRIINQYGGPCSQKNSSGPGSRGWFATLSRRKPTFLQANGAHKNAFLTNKVARANKIRKYGLAA